MAAPGNSFNIPHFLKARNPEGLRVFMLENNMKRGMEFNYYQIVYADGFWYAWFYDVAQEYKQLTKKVK